MTPSLTDQTSSTCAAGCVAGSGGGRVTKTQPLRSLPLNNCTGVPSLPAVGAVAGPAARVVNGRREINAKTPRRQEEKTWAVFLGVLAPWRSEFSLCIKITPRLDRRQLNRLCYSLRWTMLIGS